MKLIVTIITILITLLSLIYLYFALINDEFKIFLWSTDIQKIFLLMCVMVVTIFILAIYYKTKT
jgi:hypothetical protein